MKRFSDISNEKKAKKEEVKPSDNLEVPSGGDKLPANPNTPEDTKKNLKSKDTSKMKPAPIESKNESKEDVKGDVRLVGKIAKFPKNAKASKAFSFLENVKVSKNSIWYLMIEKQEDELQMVKYNVKKGVDLSKFVYDLKEYYKSKYSSSKETVKLIESIRIEGNEKFSMIKNVPPIEIEGKKMITKITEDLIRLLSK